MAKPQTQTPPKSEALPEPTLHGLIVRKGPDKRYYVERITVDGETVTSRKVVADNFLFESLCVDSTIRWRQLLADAFNPLVKR